MLPKIVCPLFLKSAPTMALQIEITAPLRLSGSRNDQRIKVSIDQQILDQQQNLLTQHQRCDCVEPRLLNPAGATSHLNPAGATSHLCIAATGHCLNTQTARIQAAAAAVVTAPCPQLALHCACSLFCKFLFFFSVCELCASTLECDTKHTARLLHADVST